MTIFLEPNQAIQVNAVMIDMYSPKEQKGVKDEGMLKSAIARPMQTVFQEDAYPTIFHKASALLESLSQNHAFYNANKRTAFACMNIFLQMNGYEFSVPTDYATEFTVSVVEHDYSFEEIVDIVRKNSTEM